MRRFDALIVGGGPAGSTCARALCLAGWTVGVLDRATFPRDKVCAGWITPEVFRLLDLPPEEYRATGLTLQEWNGFRISLMGSPPIETRYPHLVSHAIRRCEFDNFLLRRSGAHVMDGAAVSTLRRADDIWIVNEEIQAPVIVGAGGHFCPVARHVQGHPDVDDPVVAKEVEFRIDPGRTSIVPEIPELFFSRDLEGYAWCVRKGDYLNVGIGRRDRGDFATHVNAFIAFLVSSGRAPDAARFAWHGHAYHAMGAGVRPLAADGVLIAGDAAGLAYPESGEGIRPAIESGLLAAQTLIAADGRFGRDALAGYEAAVRARHARPTPTPVLLQPAVKALGRLLLRRSRAFSRRVVVERWFLRRASSVELSGAHLQGA